MLTWKIFFNLRPTCKSSRIGLECLGFLYFGLYMFSYGEPFIYYVF